MPQIAGLEEEIQTDDAQKAQIASAEERDNRTFRLGQILDSQFVKWEDAKRSTEEQLMRNLRGFNSQYDPDELTRIKERGAFASTKFVGITRYKCIAALAKYYSLLFQGPTKKNWSIEATPIPELSEQQKAQFMAEMPPETQQKMQGLNPQQLEDSIKQLEKEIAEERIGRMETKIHDQLVENDYAGITRKDMRECVILGTGAMKKATVKVTNKKRWERRSEVGSDGTTQSQAWSQVQEEEIIPDIRYASVWHLYPDPDGSRIEECMGIYERFRFSHNEFLALAEGQGFFADKIAQIYRHSPNGNYVQKWWETDVDALTRRGQTSRTDINRYEVLRYDGYVSYEDLVSDDLLPGWVPGMEIPMGGTGVVAWLSHTELIGVRLKEEGDDELPYTLTPFEEVTGLIWGVGLPQKMEESQALINDTVRALFDNISITSGPVIELDIDLLHKSQKGEVLKQNIIEPWKTYLRSGQDKTSPLLRFHKAESITNELLSILEMLRRIVDEESNLPAISQGESMWQGGEMTKTARGMQMLLNEASNVSMGNITLRDDYGIRPFIQSMYDFNMKNSEDDDIKGDMKINALGVQSYRKLEVYGKRLAEYYSMFADSPLTKKHEIQTEIAIAMDLVPEKVIYAPGEEPKNEMAEELAGLEVEKVKTELKKMLAEIEEKLAKVREIDSNIANPDAPETTERPEQVDTPAEIDNKNADTQKKLADTELTEEKAETERFDRELKAKELNHKIRKEQTETVTNAENKQAELADKKEDRTETRKQKETEAKEGSKHEAEESKKKQEGSKEPAPKVAPINVTVINEGKKERLAVHNQEGRIVGARDAKEGELDKKAKQKTVKKEEKA